MAQLNTKNFMKTAVDQTLKLIEVRTDQIHFNFFNLSNEAWKTFAGPFNISSRSEIVKFLYDFIPPMENGGYPLGRCLGPLTPIFFFVPETLGVCYNCKDKYDI